MYADNYRHCEDEAWINEARQPLQSHSDNQCESGNCNFEFNTAHPTIRSGRTWLCLATLLSILSVPLSTFALGYYLGSHHSQPPTAIVRNNGPIPTSPPLPTTKTSPNVIPHVPLSKVITTYQANDSFTQPPQLHKTEPAWDSLLPIGLGYIRNDLVDSHFSSGRYTPTTAISVVSVFHQLHCLYTLRRAFFAAVDHVDLEDIQDFDFGKPRVEHAGHCFEYLRLSLMCNADSNLEPADFAKGDFFGWNVSRQCRNYEYLKDWATDRRALDAEGFLAKGLGGHSS